jgi:hypothetical protein
MGWKKEAKNMTYSSQNISCKSCSSCRNNKITKQNQICGTVALGWGHSLQPEGMSRLFPFPFLSKQTQTIAFSIQKRALSKKTKPKSTAGKSGMNFLLPQTAQNVTMFYADQ